LVATVIGDASATGAGATRAFLDLAAGAAAFFVGSFLGAASTLALDFVRFGVGLDGIASIKSSPQEFHIQWQAWSVPLRAGIVGSSDEGKMSRIQYTNAAWLTRYGCVQRARMLAESAINQS
jgi:hypothetical protein